MLLPCMCLMQLQLHSCSQHARMHAGWQASWPLLELSKHACRAMRHPSERTQHADVIRDILDAPHLQRRVRDAQAELGPDGLCILLGFCADGVMAYRGNHAKEFSMLAEAVYVLSFPPHLRARQDHSLLLSIVPGGKEPKDAQPYLKVLADELLYLWEVPQMMWDSDRCTWSCEQTTKSIEWHALWHAAAAPAAQTAAALQAVQPGPGDVPLHRTAAALACMPVGSADAGTLGKANQCL